MKHPTLHGSERTVHLMVLEALDGAGHVSQRSLGEALGMAASRVNRVIRTLVEAGRVRVVDESVRPFAYALTRSGQDYLRELSHEHYATVVGRFRQVQHRIRRQLGALREAGAERVVFYGAGDVMEVVRPLAEVLGLRVVGVVDDDPAKQGATRGSVTVSPPGSIAEVAPDAVVITTLRHAEEIRRRLGLDASSTLRVVEL